mgnify:CR=1 FL=1
MIPLGVSYPYRMIGVSRGISPSTTRLPRVAVRYRAGLVGTERHLLPETDRDKVIYVDFDGVYRNSEVWINGHSLGFRPNGYVSFRYDLTPYLRYGSQPNVIAVKADNSEQPNSRWYSGSGIYRNVWLVKVNPVHVDNWGTFVHDMKISSEEATFALEVRIRNSSEADREAEVSTSIYDDRNKVVTASVTTLLRVPYTPVTTPVCGRHLSIISSRSQIPSFGVPILPRSTRPSRK